MCVTEIWTYRECGCSHQRTLRCIAASVVANGSGLSSLPSFQSLDSTTIRGLGYDYADARLAASFDSDTTVSTVKFMCRRGHRVNHIAHREFLESICDDCLLEEIAINSSQNPATMHRNDRHNTSAVTFAVNGKVVADNGSNRQETTGDTESTETRTRRLTPGCQKKISIKNIRSPLVTSGLLPSENISKITPFTNGTKPQSVCVVDTVFKPQQQLQTPPSASLKLEQGSNSEQGDKKQWRRRGIDLSREDLRVSSLWSNGEKQTMMNFRDALKEAANDDTKSTFSIFAKKETLSRAAKLKNLRSFIGAWRTSMIRSSSKGGLAESMGALTLSSRNQEATEQCPRLTSRQLAFRDQCQVEQHKIDKGIRAVQASLEKLGLQVPAAGMATNSVSIQDMDQTIASHADQCASRHIDVSSIPPATLSWEDHLRHDLSERSTRKKAARLASNQAKESANSHPSTTKSQPGINTHIAKSEPSSYTNITQSSTDSDNTRQSTNQSMHPYFRLSIYTPCPDSNSNSVSVSHSSYQPLLTERLDDIVSPNDFDDIDDRAGQWRNLGEIDFQSTMSLSSTDSEDEKYGRRRVRGQVELQRDVDLTSEECTEELAELATSARGVLIDSTRPLSSVTPGPHLLPDGSVTPSLMPNGRCRCLGSLNASVRGIKSRTWPCSTQAVDSGEYHEVENEDDDKESHDDFDHLVSIHPIGTKLVHALSLKNRNH